MMKKLFSLFMAAIMLLTAGGAFAAANPNVYKVEAENGNTIYLFGTFHAVKNDIYDTDPPMGAAVEEAYAFADTIAVEVDVLAQMMAQSQDLEAQMNAMLDMMYSNGETVLDHGMSEETLNAFAEMMGTPVEGLMTLKLNNWSSLLLIPVLAATNMNIEAGADIWLLSRAYEDGKKIVELESVEEQTAVLSTASDELIIKQVEDMLEYPDEAIKLMEDMYAAWSTGDGEKLKVLMDESSYIEEVDEEIKDDLLVYNESLGSQRDDEFLKDAIAYLESGEKVLIAIGAVHIEGATGIAARLAEAGYTVTEISE